MKYATKIDEYGLVVCAYCLGKLFISGSCMNCVSIAKAYITIHNHKEIVLEELSRLKYPTEIEGL